MKTLIKISTLSMLISAGAFAQTEWIETAFWKAPQASSISLKLKDRERLGQECGHFRSLVYKSGGSLQSWATTNPQRMVRNRKPIDPIFVDVDLAPYKKVEKVTTIPEEVAVNNEKLPHFTQISAKTGVNLDEFKSIKVSVKKNSYTQISRDLGLEDSGVELSMDSRAMFVVELKGLDLACDLYEGKGSLEVEAPAYIVLSDEGQEKLREFYNRKLIPEISDLFNSKKESISERAIRLGYRTGKVLENEFPEMESKTSEKLLTGVIKSLFNPKTLEVSSNVAPNNGKPFAIIPDSEEAKPVTVKLEF